MGYSITIGNGVLESEWENEYGGRPGAYWTVRKMELPDAPYSPDFTGRSNDRSPSYGVWAKFVETVGLKSLFYNSEKTGLMDDHPGIARLTKAHARVIRQALVDYRAAHPEAIPEFCPCRECAGPWEKTEAAHNPNCDGNLVRLVWLDFWVDWAVNNCERPAIYNN